MLRFQTPNGIVITAAVAVHIEGCEVHGSTQNGIFQDSLAEPAVALFKLRHYHGGYWLF
jgi:hypothetical protein